MYNRQGAQGQFDKAPKSVLASEFDTEDEESIIKTILAKGDFQTMQVSNARTTTQTRSLLVYVATSMLTFIVTQMPGRQGATNDSKSSMNTK